jgi:ABC-type Na+ efflux pump permease subunit
MAAGAAVNDMREAQSLMMPMTLLLIAPWVLWMPISRDPDGTLAIVVSFVPPLSSFGMLLRLASPHPPPTWQVLLSIGIGALGVVGAVWFASKVFRIGLLMFGKPPNFATLVRWVRDA